MICRFPLSLFCSTFVPYPTLMKKQIELDFGKVQIYDNFLVAELNEGILLDVENNRTLLAIGYSEFRGNPYGYISNRVYSYAVDPLVYRESAEFPSLKAIAVVSPSLIGRKSAEVERNFYKEKGTFAIFESFEEAYSWINTALCSKDLIKD